MAIGAASRSRSSPVSTSRAPGQGARSAPASAAKSAKAQPARAVGHSGASSFTPAPAARAKGQPALQAPQATGPRSLFNSPLAPSAYPRPSNEVDAAIRNAAKRTGMDYSFLMAMAAQESTLNPSARARTSTATGLYQFLDQTWLEQVKQHGSKHGLGEFADKISKQGGEYVVKDAAAKKQILNLRKDPEASALIGAEYSKANQGFLKGRLGRDVSPSEVYMAHFLGRNGAAKFLEARDSGRGGNSAAAEFPSAAKANRGIFYENGRARTLDEVYGAMEKKISPKVEAYTLPHGQPTYNPRTGPGTNSMPGFDPMFRPGPGGSFGFGPHGSRTGAFNTSFSYSNHGIGTIGSGGLNSFGLNGFIGSGSTYGRAGGWQFGVGFDYSDTKIAAPSFGSIGRPGLLSFGLNGPLAPSSGLGSGGVGTLGAHGLNSFGFGPHGTSTSSGGGVRGGIGGSGIGSIGGSGLGSFGFGSYGMSSGGSSSGGGSFGGSPGGGSFNASGK